MSGPSRTQPTFPHELPGTSPSWGMATSTYHFILSQSKPSPFFHHCLCLLLVSSSWLITVLLSLSLGASLLVRWLRICLPIQGAWVQSPVWEDATRLGATKPLVLQLWSLRSQSPCSVTREATAMRIQHTTTGSSRLSLHRESPCSNEKSSTGKDK